MDSLDATDVVSLGSCSRKMHVGSGQGLSEKKSHCGNEKMTGSRQGVDRKCNWTQNRYGWVDLPKPRKRGECRDFQTLSVLWIEGISTCQSEINEINYSRGYVWTGTIYVCPQVRLTYGFCLNRVHIDTSQVCVYAYAYGGSPCRIVLRKVTNKSWCFWMSWMLSPTMFQHPGMQRRPDGAGTSTEKPVNTAQPAQGVNNINTNLGGSLSPLIQNDLFMDMAPEHRFDRSALGLCGGDEGHSGMYNFGGHQQTGMNQMRPAHQFQPSHSAGYNPHSGPFSEPASRGHSIPPATPMMMGEHLRGYSVPLTPSMHHSSTPFHNTIQQSDSSIHPSIQNNFQQLLTEMQKINSRLNDIESANHNILANQQQLTERVQQNEMVLKELQDGLGAMTKANSSKSTTGKKNISNLHPGLKVSHNLPL
jgi:hypothetical protein